MDMASNHRSDDVEIRFQAPRELAEVADAYAVAHRKTRTEVLLEVMRTWAEHQVHVATVISRVTRRNPSRPDADRSGSE